MKVAGEERMIQIKKFEKWEGMKSWKRRQKQPISAAS